MTVRITPGTPLGERELEVFRLLADGHTKSQIAASLHVSHATVCSHQISSEGAPAFRPGGNRTPAEQDPGSRSWGWIGVQ